MSLETAQKRRRRRGRRADAPNCWRCRHAIHQEPELALEEFKAAQRLTDAVAQHDLPVQRESFGLKTAYVSEFGRDAGPTIAILSEYDALPGVGHACGHNIIATAGLGAALALAKLGARLPGRVRYLGTPAEERFGGKEIIAREGAFDGVDAAMMIHPSNLNLIDDALHRDLGSRSRPITAAPRTPPPCPIAD